MIRFSLMTLAALCMVAGNQSFAAVGFDGPTLLEHRGCGSCVKKKCDRCPKKKKCRVCKPKCSPCEKKVEKRECRSCR